MKVIGNTEIQETHKAICHCGAVQLQIYLPNGIVDPSRCDCSICLRKGAIVAAVPLQDLAVIKGREKLTLYQFNTYTAKHYFCSTCGIHTHHQLRSDPGYFEFNVGCLEGVNPTDIESIIIYDGVNHPCDTSG